MLTSSDHIAEHVSYTIAAIVVFPIRKLKAKDLKATPVQDICKQKRKYVYFPFFLSDETLKKRWTHLKDHYRKELKKQPV
jgi:hypothetical protein